ncbi:MAG: DUF4349 domain-containing protein [Chloroflexi bacterium]|nr:DUF4349 domain-containing protein [Chloroflexota bacterium]
MKRLDWWQVALKLAGTSRRLVKRGGARTTRLKKRNVRWSSIMLVGLVIGTVATMLASARSNGALLSPLASTVSGYENGGLAPGQPASPPAGIKSYDNGSSALQVPAPAPTTAAAMAASGATSGAVPSSQDASGTGQVAPPDWDRMIIRTATLQITVKDVGAGLDQIRSLADANAGYISGSDSRIESDYTVATITMQVPARLFDSVMSKLRAIGVKVTQENVTSSDVTEEYTDLQSQLRNLQATETRMLALQQKADKLEDILALDRELRQVQGDIEKIQGRTNFLSKRSEMSTITLSLYPDIAPLPSVKVAAEGWNPGEIAARAWNSSLQLLSGVVGAAITVAVFMWWAVPLLLLALWLAIRPVRRTTPDNPTAEA